MSLQGNRVAVNTGSSRCGESGCVTRFCNEFRVSVGILKCFRNRGICVICWSTGTFCSPHYSPWYAQNLRVICLEVVSDCPCGSVSSLELSYSNQREELGCSRLPNQPTSYHDHTWKDVVRAHYRLRRTIAADLFPISCQQCPILLLAVSILVSLQTIEQHKSIPTV